jgi:hypothetical protein
MPGSYSANISNNTTWYDVLTQETPLNQEQSKVEDQRKQNICTKNGQSEASELKVTNQRQALSLYLN